jgi:hypothetical protein
VGGKEDPLILDGRVAPRKNGTDVPPYLPSFPVEDRLLVMPVEEWRETKALEPVEQDTRSLARSLATSASEVW